jgi:hypothetical protein
MIRSTRQIFLALALPIIILGLSVFVAEAAVRSSSNYKIDSDSINFSGTENSSSANYKASDTVGETATGDSGGVLYKIKAGYRALVAVVSGSSSSGSSSSGSSGGSGPISGSASLPAFDIRSVVVAVGSNTALIEVTINRPGTVSFSWGGSSLYEGGQSVSNEVQVVHVFKLENLSAGSTYLFKLEASASGGASAGRVNQRFSTLSVPDTLPPLNARNFNAKLIDGAVRLSWQNPPDGDLESVRIVRSGSFYPTAPEDGTIVFEGRGESVIDRSVRAPGSYYYTLFVKDVSGNFSSGAVTGIGISQPGVATGTEGLLSPVTLPSALVVPPELSTLSFLDIDFFQNGRKLTEKDGTIVLDGDRKFRVAVDYGKLPEVLKTMIVSIQDKADPVKVFSFLLRVNRDRSAYEALVDSFGRGGSFVVNVSIIDHKNQSLRKLESNLVVTPPRQTPSLLSWFVDGIREQRSVVVASTITLLLLLIIGIVRFLL